MSACMGLFPGGGWNQRGRLAMFSFLITIISVEYDCIHGPRRVRFQIFHLQSEIRWGDIHASQAKQEVSLQSRAARVLYQLRRGGRRRLGGGRRHRLVRTVITAER